MRMTALWPVAGLFGVLSASPIAAQQGSPPTTPGGVTRVTLVQIKPGHADMFWNDVRQHLKPIYEEYKRRGIITDYSVGTKSTTESPSDWDVVFTLSYKNWAALDDLGPKTDPVTIGHYGSVAQRTAAANARVEHRTTVASFLVRQQTVNDWK